MLGRIARIALRAQKYLEQSSHEYGNIVRFLWLSTYLDGMLDGINAVKILYECGNRYEKESFNN